MARVLKKSLMCADCAGIKKEVAVEKRGSERKKPKSQKKKIIRRRNKESFPPISFNLHILVGKGRLFIGCFNCAITGV